jgi:hypothetical protein
MPSVSYWFSSFRDLQCADSGSPLLAPFRIASSHLQRLADEIIAPRSTVVNRNLNQYSVIVSMDG